MSRATATRCGGSKRFTTPSDATSALALTAPNRFKARHFAALSGESFDRFAAVTCWISAATSTDLTVSNRRLT